MNLFDATQAGLQQAISGASLRQTALADNIANANTPGYQRKDVDFHSALRSAMQTGDAGTISGTGFSVATDESGGTMQPDGNTVDIDAENANLASNGLEYEALVSVAKGRNDVLRAAMGL